MDRVAVYQPALLRIPAADSGYTSRSGGLVAITA